jgi:hypothetical protein
MAIGEPLPSVAMLVAAMPLPKRLVLAGITPLAGRQGIVAGDSQAHAAGKPLEDVDHEQEDLEQENEQHRPRDVKRAALQPEGEPLDPEHEDASQLVHPGPHNLVVPIEEIVQAALTTDYWPPVHGAQRRVGRHSEVRPDVKPGET